MEQFSLSHTTRARTLPLINTFPSLKFLISFLFYEADN